MSEPTSMLTFAELVKRTAVEAGIAYYGPAGTSNPLPPIDAHDLQLCKDAVNDAIRMFISDAPAKGWRWMRRIMSVTLTGTRITGTADAGTGATLIDAALKTVYDADDDLNGYYCYILTGTGAGSYAKITDYTASTGTVEVADWLDAYGNAGGTDPTTNSTYAITPVETVGGDISRYPLAENFGGEVDGEINYAASTGHNVIQWVDESTIRARRAITVNSGYPMFAAIRPLEFVGGYSGPKRRYELILDPQPVSDEVLTFPYTVYFDELRLETGLATDGGTDNITDSVRTEPDDYFIGWKVSIVDGTGKGSWAIVTDYTGSTGTITVDDWLKPDGSADGIDPVADSVYNLTPVSNLHPAGIKFDQVILSACMAQVELTIEDEPTGKYKIYKTVDLPNAIRIDTRTAPLKLSKTSRIQERTWKDITYN